jgi:hypothetical protein
MFITLCTQRSTQQHKEGLPLPVQVIQAGADSLSIELTDQFHRVGCHVHIHPMMIEDATELYVG